LHCSWAGHQLFKIFELGDGFLKYFWVLGAGFLKLHQSLGDKYLILLGDGILIRSKIPIAYTHCFSMEKAIGIFVR